MKLKRKCLGLVALCMTTIGLCAQSSVEIVEKPAMTVEGGYRAPLHGGFLKKLPVGQVKPKGWLLEILNRQKNGLNGQLGTVSDWLDKKNNQWLSD